MMYSTKVRVRIVSKNEIIYGQGISELLQRIDEMGSIHAAAVDMNMTYRKALQIIKNAEKGFRQKILYKKVGGESGGGSKLTDFGKRLVYQFKALEDDIYEYTQAKIREYLPELPFE